MDYRVVMPSQLNKLSISPIVDVARTATACTHAHSIHARKQIANLDPKLGNIKRLVSFKQTVAIYQAWRRLIKMHRNASWLV